MLSQGIDVITKYMRTEIDYRTYNELQSTDSTLQFKYLKYSFFERFVHLDYWQHKTNFWLFKQI